MCVINCARSYQLQLYSVAKTPPLPEPIEKGKAKKKRKEKKNAARESYTSIDKSFPLFSPGPKQELSQSKESEDL